MMRTIAAWAGAAATATLVGAAAADEAPLDEFVWRPIDGSDVVQAELPAAGGALGWLPRYPGDLVRVSSSDGRLDVGLGTLPNTPGLPAVAWLGVATPERPFAMRVPDWKTAAAVVVRAPQGAAADARFSVATNTVQPIEWERFEQALLRQIEGDTTALGSVPEGGGEVLATIASIRNALGPRARSQAGKAYLSLVMLDEMLAVRPLERSLFDEASVDLAGGRRTTIPDDAEQPWDDAEWAAVGPEGRLRVSTSGDVLVLSLSVLAGPATSCAVTLSTAHGPASTVRRRLRLTAEATPRQTIRLPMGPADREVFVQVEGGGLLVGAYARERRATLAGAIDGSRDPAHLAGVKDDQEGPMSALIASRAGFGVEARAALSRAVDEGENSAAMAALLGWERLRQSTTNEWETRLTEAWRRVLAAPPDVRDTLARAILTTALASRPVDRAKVPALAPLAASTGADNRYARLLAAMLSPATDGERPSEAARASALAASHPWRTAERRVARSAWLSTAPFRPLPVEGAEEEEATMAAVGGTGECPVEVDGRVRWERLSAGEHEVSVRGSPSQHQVVAFRSGSNTSNVELALDGQRIGLFGTIAEDSRVAMRGGPHLLRVPAEAGALYVRAPRDDSRPCAALFESETWYEASPSSYVNVPGHGIETVLRIRARSKAGGAAAVRLKVWGQGLAADVWLRGSETRSLEIPVAPGSGTFRFESEEPVSIQAAARLHRSSAAPLAAPDVHAELDHLRTLTEQLHAAPATERPDLHAQRAEVLARLGYRRWGAAERARSAGPTPSSLGLLNTAAPLVLAPTSPAVVALNVPAALPPSAAELLAAALEKERAADFDGAGRAFAALAEAYDCAPAAGRASTLLAQASIDSDDPRLALHAYSLAKLASLAGAPAPALARLAAAVQYVTAMQADLSAGTERREIAGRDVQIETRLPTRISRAMLGAPPEAIVIGEGRRLTSRLAYGEVTSLRVSGRCALSTSFAEGCALSIRIDGKVVHEAAGLDSVVEVPAGDHRLDIDLSPGQGAIGWVRLVHPRDGDLEPRVSSKWFSATPAQPAEFTFAGPTVVRLSTLVETDQPLQVFVDGAPSRSVDTAGVERGATHSVEIAVPAAGVHRLRVLPSRTKALLRVSFAGHRGIPGPPFDVPPAPPDADRAIPSVGIVPEDYDDGWFTVSGAIRGISEYTEDADLSAQSGGRYAEGEIALRRSFGDLAYFYVGGFVRPREGPTSFGGRARADVVGPIGAPAAHVRGQIFQQDNVVVRTSYKLRAAADWPLHLGAWIHVTPRIGVDVRDLEPLPVGTDARAADPDVFSDFDVAHPRTLLGELTLGARPTLDSAYSLRGGVRLNEFVEELDRVFVAPTAQIALASGFAPIVAVGYSGSYRLAGATRSESSLLHGALLDLVFADWIGESHRLSFGVGGRATFADQADAQVLLGIGYDFAPGRGMRDFAPFDVPFRARMAEGSSAPPP